MGPPPERICSCAACVRAALTWMWFRLPAWLPMSWASVLQCWQDFIQEVKSGAWGGELGVG